MKRLLTATLISALSLAAADAARAQAGGSNQPPASHGRLPPVNVPSQVPVSQGWLEGGTYTNDFFGLSLTVPPGWVALDVAAQQAVLNAGREVIEDGATQRKKAGIEASINRTHFLLSVSKYDLNKPPQGFNAMLSLVAERVPTAVIKTGEDYIAAMLRTAQGSAAQIELSGATRTERFGGVPFTVADAKLTTPSAVAAQKYYVTIRNGHALLFGYTYVDEADTKAFAGIMNSVKFK